MAEYIIVLEGLRTDDPALDDNFRGGINVAITQNNMPIDKVIENVIVKVAQDFNITTPAILVGDIASGHAVVTENDNDGTLIEIKFNVADTKVIDNGKANQKYIIQADVIWDDDSSNRIVNGYMLFNPGI